MARAQIGNVMEVAAKAQLDGKICDVVADAVNGFTVAAADIRKFYISQRIDMRTRSSGASVMQDRRVVGVNFTTLTVTYDGADVAATANEGIYPAESAGTAHESSGQQSVNGGASAMSPALDGVSPSIEFLRSALIQSGGAVYTDAYLDLMTENDMLYAYRIMRNGGSGQL